MDNGHQRFMDYSRHMNIHLCIFNIWIFRHGCRMDTSTREKSVRYMWKKMLPFNFAVNSQEKGKRRESLAYMVTKKHTENGRPLI